MKDEIKNTYSVIAYYEDKTVTITTNDENTAIQKFFEMKDANHTRIIENYTIETEDVNNIRTIDNHTGEICADSEDNSVIDEWLLKFIESVIQDACL